MHLSVFVFCEIVQISYRFRQKLNRLTREAFRARYRFEIETQPRSIAVSHQYIIYEPDPNQKMFEN